MASATRAAGTQALVPASTHEPSAWAVAVVAGSAPPGRITSPTSSAMAAVRIVSPLATPVSQRLALGVGAEAVEGQRAVDHRLDDGDVGRRPARRLHDQTGRDEVEPGAADVLAQVDAEQAGVGQLLPELTVEGPLVAGGRLELLEPLVCRPLAEDLPRQLADSLLLFAVAEVHVLSWLSAGSAQRPRHAEAEDRDEVPLNLVGAAAEGEDDHGSGVHLQPAGDDRGRRTRVR